MDALRLSDTLLPEIRYNTHLACLQRLADAAQRGLDLPEVAGLTGLAFRTALATHATPASLYHSWAREPGLRRCLDALGLDGEISAHDTRLDSFEAWILRQQAACRETLRRGFPVLYWDNLAYALIVGGDADGFWVSGVPAQVVHPLWLEHPDGREFCTRLIPPAAAAEERRAYPLPPSGLAPVLDHDALFVHVCGVSEWDSEYALKRSLLLAARELAGHVEYPRVLDDAQQVFAAQFGTAALNRWREEIREQVVHPFGMLLNVQALAEARRLGYLYLKRLPERLPYQLRGRLQQVCEFFERIVAHWRPAQQAFAPPLNESEQMTRAKLEACREALYQVQQTEQTAGRLLAGIAAELAEE